MQYHTGAIIEAVKLWREGASEGKLTVTGPKNRYYQVEFKAIAAKQLRVEVGGFWKCYSDVELIGSDEYVIKHKGKDYGAEDTFKLKNDRIEEGVFTSSSNGKKYAFSGKMLSKTYLEIDLVYKSNEKSTVKFDIR